MGLAIDLCIAKYTDLQGWQVLLRDGAQRRDTAADEKREVDMRKLVLADKVPQAATSVWSVIGDFSGIRKWAPIVEAEATEATPKGKVRTLTMPGGRVVSELMTSEGEFHYTYTLDRPDMKSYHSTVAVRPIDAGASMIELTLEFEPAEGVDMTETTGALLKFLGGNLKAMKRAAAA
jgi:hypothetical protein